MAASQRINLFKHCRKIIGIARNYPEKVRATEPLLFLKPTSSMIPEGKPIIIPDICTQVNHEVELGVIIGKSGSNIPVDQAMDHVSGYTLALDMTAWCQIMIIREQGLPWTLGKCFDTFCPISDVIDLDSIPDPNNVSLWLKVNGTMKQDGNTNEMTRNVQELINYCSQIMTLEEGDLILTGSPDGIGPVSRGDHIECGLGGIKEMKFEVN